MTSVDVALYLWLAGIVAFMITLIKIQALSKDQDGWWTRSILEGRKVKVEVEWNLCMGSATCTELAPSIFHLDWSKKRSVFDPAPLEMTEDRTARAEDIFRAAQSCPYRAILLEDQDSGERLFPL